MSAATSDKGCRKKKKPAGTCCASGLKKIVFSELLSTPQRARRMAVMMMAMSVVEKSHAGTE